MHGVEDGRPHGRKAIALVTPPTLLIKNVKGVALLPGKITFLLARKSNFLESAAINAPPLVSHKS